MNARVSRAAERLRIGRLALGFGFAVVLMALATPSFAQPLFAITAQNRTITATCGQMVNTLAAPDFGSWGGSVTASPPPPSTTFATASQSSTISDTGLSGSTRVNTFGGGGGGHGPPLSAVASGSLTFTTSQRLQYSFYAANASFFISNPGGTVALSGVFNVSIGGFIPRFSRVGVLDPGTYTLTVQSSQSFGIGEHYGLGYFLTFSPIDIPEVVAGPITRLQGCHRYVQLGQSTWFGAQERAAAMCGHLVTINDAAEQAWLESTFATLGPTNKWIGLVAITVTAGGMFNWISGQTSTYTHWAPGRPNFPPFGPVVHFVFFGANGLWDQGQGAIAGGIVEIEACRCDWNLDTQRDSVDLYSFLTDFFTTGADFDCSGTTTSADFFQFIACFYDTICP